MGNPRVIRFPKERSHTFYFLQYAKTFPTVHIDTTVDMTNILQVRDRYHTTHGVKYSYITFLTQIVAKVIENYPEAKSAVRGTLNPKMAYYEQIHAKFTIDKEIDGKRAVLSGLIENVNDLSLENIQNKVNYYRDLPFEEIQEFKQISRLQSLPLVIGQYIYRNFINNFQKRQQLLGTFSITSFGHRAIDHAYPVISSTLSFGVGAIKESPVIIDKEILVRPMMGITLSFDHRAIDGAMASDILSDVKKELEQYELLGADRCQKNH